jgi:putative SOS response-associated peptidase YedK
VAVGTLPILPGPRVQVASAAPLDGSLTVMCGRYASTRSAADLAELFEAVDETDGQMVPDYNVAPTDPAAIVRLSTRVEAPVLSVGRWGLVPAWSQDVSGAARMINARAETVRESRAFARSFADRRCLIPVDGWYEWRRVQGTGKQPYFMTRPESLVLAGIWSTWGTDSARLLTFSILTCPAQGDLALIHDRMPMVLEQSQWASWLRAPDPTGLLNPPSARYCAGIELRPIGSDVGDVRKDGPELIRRVAAPPLTVSNVDPSPTLF